MPSGLRDNNLKTRRHPVSPEWTLLGCGALALWLLKRGVGLRS